MIFLNIDQLSFYYTVVNENCSPRLRQNILQIQTKSILVTHVFGLRWLNYNSKNLKLKFLFKLAIFRKEYN